jgi:hypothetical protein
MNRFINEYTTVTLDEIFSLGKGDATIKSLLLSKFVSDENLHSWGDDFYYEVSGISPDKNILLYVCGTIALIKVPIKKHNIKSKAPKVNDKQKPKSTAPKKKDTKGKQNSKNTNKGKSKGK